MLPVDPFVESIKKQLGEIIQDCRDRKKQAEADILVLNEAIEDLNDALVSINVMNKHEFNECLSKASAKIKSTIHRPVTT